MLPVNAPFFDRIIIVIMIILSSKANIGLTALISDSGVKFLVPKEIERDRERQMITQNNE